MDARLRVWSLYQAFALLTGLRVRTLPGHASALRTAGFIVKERRNHLAGLPIGELWFPGDQNRG